MSLLVHVVHAADPAAGSAVHSGRRMPQLEQHLPLLCLPGCVLFPPVCANQSMRVDDWRALIATSLLLSTRLLCEHCMRLAAATCCSEWACEQLSFHAALHQYLRITHRRVPAHCRPHHLQRMCLHAWPLPTSVKHSRKLRNMAPTAPSQVLPHDGEARRAGRDALRAKPGRDTAG